MPKHDELTEEEFSKYKPPARAVNQLNQFMTSTGLTPDKVRVLDWGCGRGRFVLWLCQNGFDAHGVDIDPEPISNGQPLFEKKGFDKKRLTVFTPEGGTIHTDGSFDFIMTDNVLEHVRDLDKVMAEIRRLTSPQGGGYHIFPAQRQLIEGHLFMPLVHWIPEGALRKKLIRLCVKSGKHPDWVETRGLNPEAKTDVYYNYSTDHIFYRPYKKIRTKFEQIGFKVKFITISNPAISRNKLIGPLARFSLTKPLINWLVLTFKQVELSLSK